MRARLLICTLAAAAVLAGCSDDTITDPPPITMDMVAGSYTASGDYGTQWLRTTTDGTTTDWLARGASVTMTLTAAGQTTGRLFIPDAPTDNVPGHGPQSADFDADLTGTWSLHGDTVTFEQDADTFIRDTNFIFNGSELSGTYVSLDGDRVQLVMKKQ